MKIWCPPDGVIILDLVPFEYYGAIQTEFVPFKLSGGIQTWYHSDIMVPFRFFMPFRLGGVSFIHTNLVPSRLTVALWCHLDCI